VKLYTRPRPMPVFLLRPGDQFAVNKRSNDPIPSETGYVDADLIDQVSWSVVHDMSDDRRLHPEIPMHTTGLWHTFGVHYLKSTAEVMAREVIEIDPWSYVRTAYVKADG
jgi:hypothetical protein